jgi:20S proteasome subunit alpha 7
LIRPWFLLFQNGIHRHGSKLKLTKYDLSASTYSPDGRIFQVEYALKAVENSGTCIGIKTKTGVILAHEKLVTSKLLVKGSNGRIETIDSHVGFVAAGLLADATHLASRAREEAQNYRSTYHIPIPSKVHFVNVR